ncbi:MAG TPA: alpha-amylase family glycosyl hydrolase [Steroidobacteraceae bacterium]|jgi:glycosidase
MSLVKRIGGRLLATLFAFAAMFLAGQALAAISFRERLAEDEIIYFLLPDRFENGDPSNDRGGIAGNRLQNGFDPADKGFYHGGDLKGVEKRLDYLGALGVTAIWLAPVFANQPVQGTAGHESAGYHGYWITDFTRVDPHFGDNAELKVLIDAAHQRGMKVYLDIVVNHTADVIRYRECPKGPCPYRSRADYPYQRRGGPDGEAINQGFMGDDAPHQTEENFSHLRRADYAYTPYIPAGKETLKVPAWLNDPILYHNRGDSTFTGESSTMGDFVGLDDIMTENPRVVRGFIDIYGEWIDKYSIDGFRIDTAKHVNPEFFQRFVPAILTRAHQSGIANFHMFGEVFSPDPAVLALHTRIASLPAVLDFAFADVVRQATLGAVGTDALAKMFAEDALYAGGEAAALRLPTFVSNHDQGRYGYFMLKHMPGIEEAEALKRMMLADAMLFTLRGVPVIYYGDEQGFAGSGGDMDARQDMFAGKVEQFNRERRIGDDARAGDHFNLQHPLFREIQKLAALRRSQPALRRGRQIVRAAAPQPGLFAVSRFEPETGRELLVAFNTSTHPISAQVEVDADDGKFDSLHGRCEQSRQGSSYHVDLAPLDYIICAAPRSH